MALRSFTWEGSGYTWCGTWRRNAYRQQQTDEDGGMLPVASHPGGGGKQLGDKLLLQKGKGDGMWLPCCDLSVSQTHLVNGIEDSLGSAVDVLVGVELRTKSL